MTSFYKLVAKMQYGVEVNRFLKKLAFSKQLCTTKV